MCGFCGLVGPGRVARDALARMTGVLPHPRPGHEGGLPPEPHASLLCGAELKALLEHPACPRSLDLESLSRYLALEYVPAPHSIFAGVRKLPGGHLLRWHEGRTTIERYWDLTFAHSDERTDDEYVEEFRSHFRDAVRRRLVSDVPLGA